MRAYILFLGLALPVLTSAQKLDGAFLITASQYGDRMTTEEETLATKSVKIFKDGYWITGAFGNKKDPFGGAAGGTYIIDKGKYIETVGFYSWDSTAVGKSCTFDYILEGHRFFQSGFINSDQYKNYLIREEMRRMQPICELKNAELEGVWFLQESSYNGEANFKKPIEMVKIYAYPRFAWAKYNKSTGQFLGAGGGSYSFDGTQLIEHVEYITYELAFGSDVEIDVRVQGNNMQQTSWGGHNKELWQRAK